MNKWIIFALVLVVALAAGCSNVHQANPVEEAIQEARVSFEGPSHMIIDSFKVLETTPPRGSSGAIVATVEFITRSTYKQTVQELKKTLVKKIKLYKSSKGTDKLFITEAVHFEFPSNPAHFNDPPIMQMLKKKSEGWAGADLDNY